MPKSASKKGRVMTITRVFNSPRDRVWKAWTEPDLVRRWWGPYGFTAPVAEIDLRVGGRYLYAMRSPDGRDYWSTGVFREIAPPARLVATDSFSDEKGNVVPASHYGMEGDWPSEVVVTVTLEEQDGKTKFTLRYGGIPAESAAAAEAGWNGSFDKLAELLEEEKTGPGVTRLIAEPGRQEATVVRVFSASRERLFRAWTDPTDLVKWWAPRRFTTIIGKLEAWAGGSWRFLNRDEKGAEYWFHGVYHEVTVPSRIVHTFEFEGMPGHVILGIVTFEDRDGQTKVTEKSIFESVSDRDGMLMSGMKEGAPEVMDLLAAVVET